VSGAGHTRLLGLTLVAALAGCGPGTSNMSDGGALFFAFDRDFADYRTWDHFVLDPDAGPAEQPTDGGLLHTSGTRTIYFNRAPAHGAAEFPVGTLIVKEILGGDTFAMVKHGGGYNKSGAVDWEWFNLGYATDGTPVIRWQGITPPPSGEGYSGTAGGVCNTCHMGAAANDYVQSEPLLLSHF
jgi:hypothetical protein